MTAESANEEEERGDVQAPIGYCALPMTDAMPFSASFTIRPLDYIRQLFF